MASPADYDRRRLARSPLINTVWQIRFSSDVDLADGRAALALKQAMPRELSLTQVDGEPGFAMRMAVGPNAQESAQSQPAGWKLSSSDGATVVTLARGVLTVETPKYESWDEVFLPWIRDALSALEAVMQPGLATRMGLRYVNVIFGPTLELDSFSSVHDIRPFVDPSLLGLSAVGDVGDVDVIQGRQVITREATKVIVNHALVQSEDSETGLLVDVDVFDEGVVQFSQQDAIQVAETLHDVALAVFQRTITPEALTRMGPKEGVS